MSPNTTKKASKRKSRPKPKRPTGAKGPEGAATVAADLAKTATLATLIETLGGDLVQIVVAPKGLDIPVTEPVIYDATEPRRFEKGDLVLGVGLNGSSQDAADLIRAAAASGAAAVAIKLRGGSENLKSNAQQAGIALLGIQAEMTWNQLFSLLRSSIASAGSVPRSEAVETPVGDLFALANAVAAMVGGPATIEDPQSRVLAYSSLDEPIDEPRRQTILGRQVPEAWMKRLQESGIFKELWSSDEAIEIRLPYEGLKPRLAIAVKAGGEILGSIWVQEGEKPLGLEAKRALREAGRIAALHMIRHSAGEDIERRIRGELLRSVLEGRAAVEQVAPRIGLDANSPFTVVVFQLLETDEADGRLLERASGLAALYLETFHRKAVCAPIGNSIFALVPTPENETSRRMSGVCRKIIDQVRSSLKVEMSAGIGSTVPRLGLASKSREEADRVLRVLAGLEEGRDLASIDDVRPQSILVELSDLASENPRLGLGRLEVLRQHDADNDTDYVRTLRAYFDAYGDISAAAKLVNVHSNTFRYRMRRLGEISGLDLDDPDERLVTELQLRII